jgi:hypothetical protein
MPGREGDYFSALGRILLDGDRSTLWRGRFYEIIHLLTGAKEAEKRYISMLNAFLLGGLLAEVSTEVKG